MGMDYLNEITEKVIGCAIEVHRNLGPGLLESIYEKALCYELEESRIEFDKQVTVLKLTRKKLGLLINFNVPVLKNGIKRIIL